MSYPSTLCVFAPWMAPPFEKNCKHALRDLLEFSMKTLRAKTSLRHRRGVCQQSGDLSFAIIISVAGMAHAVFLSSNTAREQANLTWENTFYAFRFRNNDLKKVL